MIKRPQFGGLIRWVWRHKLRCSGSCFAVILAAYAVVFLLVSCATSPTDHRISLDDGRELAFQQFEGAGDAGRLILVHGAPADATSWTKLLKRHQRDLPFAEIIVVDRLGYGNSTAGSELSLERHAASLAPLLETNGGRKPVLVGHSYGGPVVLRVAADYPDRVGSIALVAGACDPYMNDSQWFRELVNGIAVAVPEPWEVANRELLALTDENRAMEPLLDRVTCPVTVIHGTWDPVCPYDGTVSYLQNSLTHAAEVRVMSMERAGHNLHLSHPQAIVDAVTAIAPSP